MQARGDAARSAAPAPGGTTGIIFPPDTRVRINPTTGFPARCIGQLVVQFPNGEQYAGTGTLIDELHVLTCAHLLYCEAMGGSVTEVTFVPARNGTVAPFGPFAAAQIAFPEEYRLRPVPLPRAVVKDYTRYLYDFGVVTLAAPVEFPRYPAPYWVDDAGLAPPATCFITGYPGDKPNTLWQAGGSVQTEESEQFLFYRISASEGESGSAVMGAFGLQVPAIVGIHVAGTVHKGLDTNFAVRLNPEVIQTIIGWL